MDDDARDAMASATPDPRHRRGKAAHDRGEHRAPLNARHGIAVAELRIDRNPTAASAESLEK